MLTQHKRSELTAKEWRIVVLVADGLKNIEVGQRIGTTEHVIKNVLRSVYDKLGLWNRTELALWYVKRQYDKHIGDKEIESEEFSTICTD